MLKNTSGQSVTLFAFDYSTGAPKTGDAANMVFYVAKDDGAVTAITANSGVPTEVDATNDKGSYKIALSQTETNATKLRISGKSSTSNVAVVPQTIYPAVVDWGNVVAPTTTVGLSGTTVATVTTTTTATNVTNVNGLADGVITAAKIATGAITAAKFAAGAIDAAAIADGAIDTATFVSGTTIPRCTLTDTLTTYTGNTVQTGDSYAIVNSGAHGNAAIKGYVDDIGTAGAGLTAIPWNAAWDAEVQSEVQDAIEVNHLDHLIGVADPGSIVANSSLWAALTSKSVTPAYSSYNNTTDSHEALRDRGDAAWTTATGFSTLDAAGVRTAVGLASANLDTQLTTIDDFLDTEVAAIKAKTDQLTFTTASRVDSQVFGMETGTVTAAAVATGAIDADALASDAVAEIWTTALTESYAMDGAAFTGAQGMFMIWSALAEFAISGTTITAKKLDGATTAMSFTLDSSTSPTSRTRTS